MQLTHSHQIQQVSEAVWTLSDTKDTVYIATALFTIGLAIFGYFKWKKELKWKAHFDFSYRFLKKVYTIRDTLNDQRSISYDRTEILEPGPPSEEETMAQLNNTLKVYKKRSAKVSEAAQGYNGLLAEGEALIGKDFRKIADQLVVELNKYRNAIQQHNDFQMDRVYGNIYAVRHDTYSKNVNPIIHRQGGKGKDPFGDQIEKIVKALDVQLVKFLK